VFVRWLLIGVPDSETVRHKAVRLVTLLRSW